MKHASAFVTALAAIVISVTAPLAPAWAARPVPADVEFTTTMTAATEVPPKTSPGDGDVLATLDTKTKVLTYTVTFANLTGPATMAHFHGPAAPGANAGVAVPLGTTPTSPIHGTAKLTDAQIKDLMAGKWYANVHTAANPGGEIRGQMMMVKN
jgi:hypothetical protein